MDSKYIHLIALIVAVFFAGVYLRGEGARKSDIKRELKVIEMRQAEINTLIGEINGVAAQKDSLLKLKIAEAKYEIRLLNREELLVRDSLDVLGDKIRATNVRLNELAFQINNVPDFIIEPPDLHSVHLDPDASILAGQDFEEIPTFTGRPLLDVTVAARDEAPAFPAYLSMAMGFADQGVMEDPPGSNRSPDIDRWLGVLGLEPFENARGEMVGHPYCAAFVSFCLHQNGDVDLPKTKSARARDYIFNDSFVADMLNPEVEARIVQRGGIDVKPGAMAIWKLKKDPQDTQGHIGFVISWEGQKGKTVEANTSPPGGNQREGLGVFFKERTLEPMNFFRITHFTNVLLKD